MKKLLAKIRKILKDRRTRQLLTRIVSITAAIVVFVTTYALVLPAITMESEANCGIPAHQHDDSCYEDQLICGQVESPGHQHTDACYSISKSLICTENEHQHDDSCFDADGNLTCELAEHTHDDSCYEEVRELVCDIPESEGHEHTDDCYERVLACGMEAHTHSTACYSHGSELTASAPSDFAAVATTELGSYGATVSASTETDTNSEETSNTWASDESAAGGLSSTAAGVAAADYSSTATAAGTASTGFDAATSEDAFVPQLEPIFFDQLLTKDTGIYYYHAEEGEVVPENSADIADWKRVNDDTELASADLLRVYLRYTIPAGSLNPTNDIARYRLPYNLHLTDQQVEAINSTVNGIANQYVSLDTLEITDTEKYNQYLGVEATEGTRTPSDDIDKYLENHPDMNGQEYISAVVRVENIFDDTTDEYLGQDLVFTFPPYTVQKNQHEYDADGQPTKAGEKVNGWFCFDLNMDQIDWSEPVISTVEDDDVTARNSTASDITTITERKESSAEIIFATKDKALKIDEISTDLHMVELNTIEAENESGQDENDQSADESSDSDMSEITDNDTTDTSDSDNETNDPRSIDAAETDTVEKGTEETDAAGTDTTEDETADQSKSAVDVNEETYPVISFEDTITVQAGTLSTDNESAAQTTPAETTIKVSVIAEAETFPRGTTMQLGTVEDMDAVASAVEGTVEGQTRGFHAVDISFHNANGEEIEPLKPIKVSMTSEAIKQAVEDSSTVPVVVHVENPANNSEDSKDSTDTSADTSPVGSDKNEKAAETEADSAAISETGENTPAATIIETKETSGTDNSSKSEEAPDTLSFDADSFSVYAIVYTVDFEYSVNGKMYQFSLPGGGFVSFTDLVEVLGIIGDTKNGENEDETGSVIAVSDEENAANEGAEEIDVNSDTNPSLTLGDVEVSEATRKFVADVASVEFSTPSLVDVSKVESETTVGQIKENRGLECEYSAELTKEQIAEINAQTVEAGDWALISVQPFTSEEQLTVTMKDGEVFKIRVTDAQIKKTVIDAKGDTWEITVTYGEDAQIPNGAELKVREILPEDEEYEQYYQQSLEKVGVVNTKAVAEASEEPDLVEETVEATEEVNDPIKTSDLEKEEQTATQTSDYARIFDIEIWADDHKVEPAADVTVSIKLLDAPGETEATPQVVHFAEDGAELMVLKEKAENSEDEGIQFVTDEFSVYSVVYTVDFSFNINGKEYSFSLEGGDSTSFKEIIERFKILDKENVELFINNIATVEFSNPDYLWNGKLEEDAFAGDLKEKYNLDIQYASNIREGNILAMNVHHYSAPDWVLIALKPFSSEEALSITMKNGEKFTVKVTDAQSDAFHNTDGTVQTIPNPQGTTFELFNYYVSEDTKTTAGRDQWPGHIHDDNEFWKFNWYNFDGSYARSWNDGFWYNGAEVPETWRQQHLLGYGNNLGINKNHNFKFSPANAGTVIDGTKGTVTKDVDGGSGLNGWTQDADPYQGIVQDKLSNGYPILTNDSSKGTDGTSLAYLFDNTTHEGKDSYGNVNNLLYVDPDGYYTYDSRDFKAEYQNNGTFKLTDQPDTTDTEVKGFWPFGTKVYWSGLHMNTQFSMPENGQVLNPKDELKDMQFEFSGDDDTWLYVDGVLVGDGGGIHNRTEIDVNFATGKVIVTGLEDTVHTGSFYQEKWLDQIFIDAGKFNDSDWEDIGDGSGHKRFKAGTYHTFDMFYLERGGGESNLYIHYNLVSTDDFTGHKSYEGFADGERMARDQFHFELIGLDGQYQSVWNETTQSADVSLVSATKRAIMPGRGSETGTGSYADPKKVYSSVAYTDSDGHTIGGTILTSGVLENGDIRFGSANISADEMLACDQGHPSVYRYIIREIVPDDAVNDDGITWAEATDEQKEAGGFVKDQVLYDREVYYMTARVTSWNQTGSDGQTYKAYGLSKTYYTDDTFTEVDNSVSFVDFRNIYAPDSGSVEFTKVDGSNHPLQGAVFTLYTDEACTKIAKDLGDAENGVAGVNQVKTSGTDGKVSFENMAAPRTYYMRETTVPTGYSANNTVYKVIIEDHKDHTKSSRILINADGSETEINKIVNTKDGELSVIKEWHDQNGNVVDGGSKTARVKIQRKKYQAGSSGNPHTVNFTIKIDGRDDLVYTYTATNIIGKMVTIDWWDTNQSISSITVNGNSASVTENYWDVTNHKNRKLVIENVNTDVNVTVVYPSDKSWLFDGDHGSWMKNVSVAGSGLSYELTPDTAFNSSTENSHFATLSSPGWNKTWTLGTGKDFPSSDGTNDYVYYVIEVDNEGNELEADKETELGYKLIKYSASNETGVVNQGSIVIYNEIDTPLTTDINIKKVKEDGSTGLSGAIFRLKVLNGSYQYVSGVTGYTEISGIGNVTVDDVVYSDALLTNGNIQSITGLPDGTYQLEEVKTPNGYINAIGSIEFKVEGGVITSQTAENSDKVDLDTTGTIGLLTITNTPGAALPNTGGPGTRLFTILGSILILGAGVLLWRRRRLI